MNNQPLPTEITRNNLSRIRSSFEPRDYSRARFGADLGDADLPLTDPE